MNQRPLSPYAVGRVLDVSGTSNFRDFVGHVAPELARNRAYRSAHLARLDDVGRAAVARCGIATIIDLRGLDEAARAPSLVDASLCKLVSAPIEPQVGPLVRALIADPATRPEAMRDVMLGVYRNFVLNNTPRFGAALAAVADHGGRPFVIHCAAGKDRTGFLAALIQRLVGASEEAVIEDYLITNGAWRGAGEVPPGHNVAASLMLRRALPEYLEAAFDTMARAYGSVDDFAVAATGDRTIRPRLMRALAAEAT